MDAIGIICELDPLHAGHAYLFRRAKQESSLPIVCAMSGNFTQRGGIACLRKASRAEMAVRCGADLVLELPTPWAMATAEQFARGGVSLLAQAGVKALYCGSECGDAAALQAAANALLQPQINDIIRKNMAEGLSYAAARQEAIAHLPGVDASLLAQPNNTLAIEYLKAIRALPMPISFATVQRVSSRHGGEASASHIRTLLRSGEAEAALGYLPPEAAAVLRREIEYGRAPTRPEALERAMLARLRLMEEEDFRPYDGGGEGLYHRVYQAVQQSSGVEEILTRATAKRYPTARIRRLLWAAFLQLSPAPDTIPYLRVLAANADGCKLLRQMQNAGKPVLTKPADVRQLSAAAQMLFRAEARRTDVFALAQPTPSPCGSDWRETPIIC